MYNWGFTTLIHRLEPDQWAWAGLSLFIERDKQESSKQRAAMKVSMLTQMMLLINDMNLCVIVSYSY